MNNRGQHGADQQNMGCNMNGYPPSSSLFMAPNYMYPQPVQEAIPAQPIPFPGISAPPMYPIPSPVVSPPQQIPNDVVIDLANSASDDDSSDESVNASEPEANPDTLSALHESIALCFLLPRY